MMRSTVILALLLAGAAPRFSAQARDLSGQRESFGRAVVHNGKWLTAASVAALIMFAEREHNQSQRAWNSLLDICRSAQDACALAPDGRYVRSDAEQLYQRSRAYDRRANHWLLGAQASLLATTALFIIDLHPGEGPDNIPFAPMQVGVRIPF
jgi:hypothetical protein